MEIEGIYESQDDGIMLSMQDVSMDQSLIMMQDEVSPRNSLKNSKRRPRNVDEIEKVGSSGRYAFEQSQDLEQTTGKGLANNQSQEQ